jgi:hypothetical protein
LEKATVALRQSDGEVLFVVYLLLADMFKRGQNHETALVNFDKALTFIESGKSQEDSVLQIEVKLEKLERSLKLYSSETKDICLKVIV